eukprot:2276648-Prymnesium_polylepis.1
MAMPRVARVHSRCGRAWRVEAATVGSAWTGGCGARCRQRILAVRFGCRQSIVIEMIRVDGQRAN